MCAMRRSRYRTPASSCSVTFSVCEQRSVISARVRWLPPRTPDRNWEVGLGCPPAVCGIKSCWCWQGLGPLGPRIWEPALQGTLAMWSPRQSLGGPYPCGECLLGTDTGLPTCCRVLPQPPSRQFQGRDPTLVLSCPLPGFQMPHLDRQRSGGGEEGSYSGNGPHPTIA